jgi:hypothetical protein
MTKILIRRCVESTCITKSPSTDGDLPICRRFLRNAKNANPLLARSLFCVLFFAGELCFGVLCFGSPAMAEPSPTTIRGGTDGGWIASTPLKHRYVSPTALTSWDGESAWRQYDPHVLVPKEWGKQAENHVKSLRNWPEPTWNKCVQRASHRVLINTTRRTHAAHLLLMRCSVPVYSTPCYYTSSVLPCVQKRGRKANMEALKHQALAATQDAQM